MLKLVRWLPVCGVLLTSGAVQARGEAGWFDDPAFQRRLDRQTHSRAFRGNEVKLLVNGVNSYRQRQRNVAEADVVLLKTYNFREDATGRQMVSWLEDRLARGKQVFVQFDVKGSTKSPFKLFGIKRGRTSPIPATLQRLVDRGAVVIPTNAPGRLRDCNPVFGKDHEKYLITWRRGGPVTVVMGGMNVGDEWARGGDRSARVPALHGAHGFRDTDVQVLGPVTRAIVQEFLADALHHGGRYREAHSTRRKAAPKVKALASRLGTGLAELRQAVAQLDREASSSYAKRAADANCRFVANRPLRGVPGQYIENLFSLMLERAPGVTLSNAFFLPTKRLLTSLEGAAARGAPTRMLLNGTDAVEHGFRLVAKRARKDYRYLLQSRKAGDRLKIFEWHGDPSKGVSSIHQKVWAFGDGAWDPFGVGSSNLDFHSLRRNSEGVLLIQDPKTKRALDRALREDFAAPGVERVRSDQLPGRLKLWFQSLFPPRSWL
jgi:phosphatidylserine/phosphatidylglycerophosphate/cardiolipin synthase-like enzyme